jgi:hypothetical protein
MIRPKLVWAIVTIKNPKINPNELYQDRKGICIVKGKEKFIRVEIKEVKKNVKR